jgi:3-methyladenine DNA glycosylase/8-oxoguanine DNA glycosylase
MLAQQGQGRFDAFPAGDLGFLKLIGRRLSGGDPYARATEEQVRETFAPYGRWAGPAAVHALRTGGLRSAGRPIEAAAA